MRLIYLAATIAAFFVSGCQTTPETAAEKEAEIVVTVTPTIRPPMPACFERGALIDHLNRKFDEHPSGAGLAANGSVLELLISPDGLTWTIILSQPNGAVCVMASGERWINRPLPERGNVS